MGIYEFIIFIVSPTVSSMQLKYFVLLLTDRSSVPRTQYFKFRDNKYLLNDALHG